MKELQPFLADGMRTARSPRLTFDLAKLEGRQKVVYIALARYLTDPIHSNFPAKHNTLADKLQKTRKLLDLT